MFLTNEKKFRHVLSTKQDFEEELLEQSFVKKCKVESGPRAGLVFIYVKLSFFDYIFRMTKIIEEIHGVLRPKANFMLTYEIKPKLFL